MRLEQIGSGWIAADSDQIDPSSPQKRGPRASNERLLLDPRFRGGDEYHICPRGVSEACNEFILSGRRRIGQIGVGASGGGVVAVPDIAPVDRRGGSAV